MVSNKDLAVYYDNHANEFPEDFPIKFTYDQTLDLLEMRNSVGNNVIACLSCDSIVILVNDGSDIIFVSMQKKCQKHQFNYDLNNPHDILYAFIDIVFNTCWECVWGANDIVQFLLKVTGDGQI